MMLTKNDKINILVMGNSGCGKSTLINAVLDNKVARTSIGERGTDKMEIYETEKVPFRLIDSKGMEHNFWSQLSSSYQIKRWTKEHMLDEVSDKRINLIWYCVDSQSKRLFEDNLKLLKSVTKFYHNVPIVVVLTKAYSEYEKVENETMVNDALRKTKLKINVKGIVHVVAKQYQLNDTDIIPPSGIAELIDKTISLTDHAKTMTDEAINEYKVALKRKETAAVIATASASAAAVGAVPIPISDAIILVPIQTTMIKGIAKIYEIPKDSCGIINVLVECGTTSAVAKTVLSGLKAVIPVAGSVLNAIVAASFTAAIGEISAYIMEKIYLGEKSADDLDWAKQYAESEFKNIIESMLPFLKDLAEHADMNDMKKIVKRILKEFQKKGKKRD